jgi:excisionase family DNA binding protein
MTAHDSAVRRELLPKTVQEAQTTPGDASERLTLTVEQAAAILGVSRAFAYELARTGELPSVRLGRRIVIPRRALVRLLDV